MKPIAIYLDHDKGETFAIDINGRAFVWDSADEQPPSWQRIERRDMPVLAQEILLDALIAALHSRCSPSQQDGIDYQGSCPPGRCGCGLAVDAAAKEAGTDNPTWNTFASYDDGSATGRTCKTCDGVPARTTDSSRYHFPVE
jgi:hypothetical protein